MTDPTASPEAQAIIRQQWLEKLAHSSGKCPECGKNIGHYPECSQHET